MSKTRMIEAVKQLDVDAVSELLATDPRLLSVTDRRGFNLLHLACCVPCADLGIAETQSAKVVRLLLETAVQVPPSGMGVFSGRPDEKPRSDECAIVL